ncbi:MAG: molecular chaperone HtpG [Armatimonadetes bacterium]|nr:molecular chaperone HtpG [Armatimonadota bacterium]
MSQATVETHEFQAEARQLLELMIHSVYSEKDIFLRELISNASDALDKLRVEALVQQDWNVDTSDQHVLLEVDKENRTLSVIDNGIGMTRDEVVNLIGTIAKSGTGEFLQALKDKGQPVTEEMIGQFGVGFYSSFMVADQVTLVTRKPGEEKGIRWQSTGDGSFTVETIEKEDHGTRVTLHLKPPDPENRLHDYTEVWKLREIVKRYSDFIAYPIRMYVERTEVDYDDEGKPKGEATRVTKLETFNSQKALWARPQQEVTQDEYYQFYRHVSHDWNDPWLAMPLHAEGTFEYQALMFVPKKASFDLFMPGARRGLQLYVKRVFIMDECVELIPEYLRFVRGVVDARDLPLNISREILQKDRRIEKIRNRLVKKVLDQVEDARNEKPEEYRDFWMEFGRVLKEGLFTDAASRDRILKLCLFHSTRSEEWTTLQEYLGRAREGQDTIYYLTGESRAAVESSPHLEAFKARDIEVLILTDNVDEVWLGTVFEYEGKKFQSAAKGELELGTEEEKKAAAEERERKQKEHTVFLSWLQSQLEKEIKEARLSSRLTESAACLVGEAHDLSGHLERLMRSMGQDVPRTRRVLELNPDHPLVQKLHQAYEEKKDDPELREMAHLLYGMAVLAEGGELEEPARFSKRLAGLMARSL